jgi:phosphopentomutase
MLGCSGINEVQITHQLIFPTHKMNGVFIHENIQNRHITRINFISITSPYPVFVVVLQHSTSGQAIAYELLSVGSIICKPTKA